MTKVAALYVEPDGAYSNLPGVDPWDEARDARLYDGPHPVVAHPPCERWGDMWMGSPLVIARTGERKNLGDDGGCFAAALAAVRKHGGLGSTMRDNDYPQSGAMMVMFAAGMKTSADTILSRLAAGHPPETET